MDGKQTAPDIAFRCLDYTTEPSEADSGSLWRLLKTKLKSRRAGGGTGRPAVVSESFCQFFSEGALTSAIGGPAMLAAATFAARTVAIAGGRRMRRRRRLRGSHGRRLALLARRLRGVGPQQALFK